jgi:hypothetical protein
VRRGRSGTATGGIAGVAQAAGHRGRKATAALWGRCVAGDRGNKGAQEATQGRVTAVLATRGARARRGRAQEERRRWEVECEQKGARGKARASDAEFIGARRPGIWHAGMRRHIGLGLILESGFPTGETRLG